MSWWQWLLSLFRRAPGRVTDVRVKVIPMQEISVEWAVPAIREDGSPMPVAEIAHTEASLSTDAGKTWVALAQVRPNETQIVKRAPAPDGAYIFWFVAVGVNGKKGKPVDTPVTVDTPAPGLVSGVKVTVT